tara:strand:- start:10209 stop:11429 length:1221 start_codon:yes stop_codon:yes gene_type:complete
MPPQIIKEGVFQALFDTVGMGTTWKVLKGRFLTAFRAWGAVIDIWKSDTEEDIKKIRDKAESDLSEIKARYREAETQYAKENSLFNSTMGTNMMFFHPGLALTEALIEPLLDETYRSDVRRLLPYTGIQEWGLTPDFVSNWIDNEAKIEKQTARATVAGADGTSQTIDIFSYADKNDETQSALNALHGLFVTESKSRLIEAAKPFDRKDAEKLAKTIVAAYESKGVLASIEKTGQKIKKVKEQIIADVVVPSAETIKVLSDMLSSEDASGFSSNMSKLSKINKSLSGLKINDFKSTIKSSVDQIMSDESLIEKIKSDTGTKDITKEAVEQLVFENARNDFAKSTIDILETVYEDNLTLLMDGITESGLEAMKSTDVGEDYAKLIENNIQLLENAIKSLNDLATKGA